MFATPRKQQTTCIDKENVNSEAKTPGKSLNLLATPNRKPLSSLNQDVTSQSCKSSHSGKILPKIWTPLKDCTPKRSNPASKTHGTQSKSLRKSKGQSVSFPSKSSLTVTEAAKSLLHVSEVFLKEITAVSYASKKNETESESKELVPTASDGDHLLNQTVKRLVYSTLDATMQELSSEQMHQATLSCPTCVTTIKTEPLALISRSPTTDRLWNIALGLDDSSNNSALLMPQGVTSFFLENTPSPCGIACTSEVSSVREVKRDSTSRMDSSPSMVVGKSSFIPIYLANQETRLGINIQQDKATLHVHTVKEDGDSRMSPARLVHSLPGPTSIICNKTSLKNDSTMAEVHKLETVTKSLVELEPLMQVMPAQKASNNSCMVPIELPGTSSDIVTLEYADSGTAVDSHSETSASLSTIVMDSHVMTTPITATNSTSMATPIQFSDAGCRNTPIKVAGCTTVTMPTHPIDAGNETTLIEVTDYMTMTPPACSVDTGNGITPTEPVEVLNRVNKSVNMTPVQLRDSAVGTSPVKYADANFGTTPVKVSESLTATTPANLIDASVGHSPIKPVEMLNKLVMVTPIKILNASIETISVESCEAKIGTTPVKSADVGLCTDPAQICDSSTATSPVRVIDVGVGTDPHQTADIKCGPTPVRLVDMNCGTTPHTSLEASTSTTPVSVNAAETLTSPIVVPAFKLEADSPSLLDTTCLMSHMESASISNELLRREIQTFKSTQAELQRQLDGARDQLKVVERVEQLDQRVELRQTAKETLQNEVDKLLLQVGELMNQLAILQAALDQKSCELANTQQEKMHLRDQYQKELHNMQQDLCTAYKQHQQEVSEIHAFYKKNNYESHYKRAIVTIAELQTEIQAYTDLKDTLQRAAEIQEQFGCIEEAYSLVNALFNRTMDKKDELEQERMEIVDHVNQIKTENEQLRQQLQIAEEEQQCLQTQLDDTICAEKEALKCQDQLLQELNETSQTLDEIKLELRSTRLELLDYKDNYETSKTKNEELRQESINYFLKESTMEAALALQGKQWQDCVAEVEVFKSQTEVNIQNLMLENTSMKQQLSASQDLIALLQSELERNNEILNQQVKELDNLKAELEMNREARVDAQRMANQMQTLRKQFKESIEFLEEERVALVESAREVEDQLQVTNLELSRLKMALSNAEEVGSQWKGATENLSEKLQSCQSELDNTKAHAHWMLLNQATEMRDASDGLAALLQKMQGIHSCLNTSKEREQLSNEASLPQAASELGIKTKSVSQTEALFPSSSLVASILSAVHSKEKDINDEDTATEQNPCNSGKQLPRSPSPETKLTIGASGSSAFISVQKSTNKSACTTEEVLKERTDNSVALIEQVEQVKTIFGQMMKVLLARNETLESVVKDLNQKRTQLKDKLQKSQGQYDRELCIIHEQLHQSEMQERRLRQEVANSNASLTEQQQALHYAQQRLQAMAENLGRFSDQKSTIEKLQRETAKLTSTLRIAQREKSLLQEQLDTILLGCSQSSNEDAVDEGMTSQPLAVNSDLVRENLSLKKELEKLRAHLVDRQEHYERLNTRATKHMRVLEDNWHKADAEVYRLDELFDHCKQLMEKIPASSDFDPNMSALRELLI
ncbi:CAP-Gly domain-containing linker protein 1-like isoform X2 [Acanthaster planci]|uniref:CAP-Gly domain-containing linker protein 1-like isoform X2 n=1 Tax=Acanthaster planci TaxID=133434 RepID=A0A8B7ZW82_ACAPL|nr:CAP-Gly domain-containing linker protein 1-like isoform X2 [Acanthaster planci]